jgi:hypothetical protein
MVIPIATIASPAQQAKTVSFLRAQAVDIGKRPYEQQRGATSVREPRP